MPNEIGTSPYRKEASNKVTGAAKYAADMMEIGLLYAKMVTSPHAHAKILSIDSSNALNQPGVRAVITGKEVQVRAGSHLEDRPILAIEKVRYCGEPVAIVVADTEYEAKAACNLIRVEYDILPNVNTLSQALQANEPLVHESLSSYKQVKAVFPKYDTNIANWTKVRKGEILEGWKLSEITAEADFSFPQSDHAAMETRCSYAEITPGGEVSIISASQAPFNIKKLIHKLFHVPLHKLKCKNVSFPCKAEDLGGGCRPAWNCSLMLLPKR